MNTVNKLITNRIGNLAFPNHSSQFPSISESVRTKKMARSVCVFSFLFPPRIIFNHSCLSSLLRGSVLTVVHTPIIPVWVLVYSMQTGRQPSDVFSHIFPDDSTASANIPSLIRITERSWWGTRIQLSKVVPQCVYTQFLCRQMSLRSPSGRQGDLPSKTTSPDFGVFNLKLYKTVFN